MVEVFVERVKEDNVIEEDRDEVRIIYRIIRSCRDCPKMKVIGNPVSCNKAPFLCTEIGKRIKTATTIPEWCPLADAQTLLDSLNNKEDNRSPWMYKRG